MKIAYANIFLSVFLLAGCVAPMKQAQQAAQLTPFEPEEISLHVGDGEGVIRGQAFLRQRGGGVVTCAGAEVIAVPATPYYRVLLRETQGGRTPTPSQVDQRAGAAFKKSHCDAQGGFEFTGLPIGTRWIIVTEVQWTVGYSRQGGSLMTEVNAMPGRPDATVLSDGEMVRRR